MQHGPCFEVFPDVSDIYGPVRYLESVKACGPATKQVLYVEVVPKGFVKIQHLPSYDESLQDQDPLMTVTQSPPPLDGIKNTNTPEEANQNQEKKSRKHKDKHKKLKTKKNNSIDDKFNKEIKDQLHNIEKLDSIDNFDSLPSPDRCSSPEWPPSPKRKKSLIRRKKKKLKKFIDHTSSTFTCNRSNCDFSTTELTELNLHRKNDHKGRKDFQCDQCIYRGATASDLRKHYRQHSGEIPYICTMSGCDFRAKHNNSLVYHTKKYHPTGEPLKCDASESCIFSTYLKAALKHHKMMQHGGGKSLACEICPYKCYLMADLRKHHRVHTGESPYVCDFEGCSYACKISSNLKKHKRIHTEEKPYFCDACDFRTNFINSLKVHKRTHTNERPYCCDQCGYRCNHTSNLKKHVARVHPGAPYNFLRKSLD